MLRWGRGKNEEPTASSPTSGPAAAAAPPLHDSATTRTVTDAAADPVAPPRTLQDLLLTEGKITDAQLQQALRKQAETGRFIGEILIEDKVLDQDSLISFLAKHCRIPHLSLLDYLIDKDIVKLLPEAICLQYRLLPIDRLGKNLTVAMVNPLDSEALERVRACCPELRIKPILCASNHFDLVVSRLFASAEKAAPHEVSTESLGLGKSNTPPRHVTPTPPSTPEVAEVPSVPPVVIEPARIAAPAEVELPPLAPLQDPATVASLESTPVPVLEELPEAEEIPIVTPLPEPVPVAETAATVLSNVFSAPPEPAPSPAALEESTLNATSSSLMKEMATVMMDSMRDTYAVLARRMELFRGVPPEEVAKIFARGITQEFESGDVIFEKGQLGTDLYVILGGEVEIRDGERVLAQLSRGGMFGEMALISAQPRSATAVAADTTSVLSLSQDTIRQGMPPHVSIQVLSNIITTLSARLREANTR